jgi:predicted protein tyrosine phosphatase
MKFYVCDIRSVAEYQQKYNITKTLSLINDYHKKEYMNTDYKGEHTVIHVRDHEWYQNEQSPSYNTVERIIEFRDTLTEDDNVLVHCIGGISRSPAALLIILDKFHGLDKAREMLEEIRPFSFPNSLICKLYNEELGQWARQKV